MWRGWWAVAPRERDGELLAGDQLSCCLTFWFLCHLPVSSGGCSGRLCLWRLWLRRGLSGECGCSCCCQSICVRGVGLSYLTLRVTKMKRNPHSHQCFVFSAPVAYSSLGRRPNGVTWPQPRLQLERQGGLGTRCVTAVQCVLGEDRTWGGCTAGHGGGSGQHGRGRWERRTPEPVSGSGAERGVCWMPFWFVDRFKANGDKPDTALMPSLPVGAGEELLTCCTGALSCLP